MPDSRISRSKINAEFLERFASCIYIHSRLLQTDEITAVEVLAELNDMTDIKASRDELVADLIDLRDNP